MTLLFWLAAATVVFLLRSEDKGFVFWGKAGLALLLGVLIWGDSVKASWDQLIQARQEAMHQGQVIRHAERHNPALVLQFKRLTEQLETVRTQLKKLVKLRDKAGSQEARELLTREIDTVTRKEAELASQLQEFSNAMEKGFVTAQLDSGRRERQTTEAPGIGLAETAAEVSLQTLNEKNSDP